MPICAHDLCENEFEPPMRNHHKRFCCKLCGNRQYKIDNRETVRRKNRDLQRRKRGTIVNCELCLGTGHRYSECSLNPDAQT